MIAQQHPTVDTQYSIGQGGIPLPQFTLSKGAPRCSHGAFIRFIVIQMAAMVVPRFMFTIVLQWLKIVLALHSVLVRCCSCMKPLHGYRFVLR